MTTYANGPPKRPARHLTAAPSPPSVRGADEARVTQAREPVLLAEAVAAYVAADPGPVVTLATALQWAQDAAAQAYEAGWDDGRLDLIADEKRAQRGIAAALHVGLNPWHVCCRPCRLRGHRRGCRQCQERDRLTFGQAHPDDYPGQDGGPRARAHGGDTPDHAQPYISAGGE